MRHKLLIVLLVALAATAGCLNGDDVDGGDTLDFVPDTAEGVVQVDMGLLEDPTTEQIADAMIDMEMEQRGDAYDGPESYADMWEEFEAEADFDPREVNEITGFGTQVDEPGEENAGFVVSANVDVDEILGALEQLEDDITVEIEEYSGVDIHVLTDDTGEAVYLAELDEGVFSVGERGPVEETVDVAVGDASPLSGELREELDRVRDGYIKFALVAPDQELNGDVPSDAPFDMGAFEEVTVTSGSYYTGSDYVGVNLNMRTGSAESATEIVEAIDGALALSGLFFDDPELQSLIDAIETDVDDTTAIVTYEITVDDIVEGLEALSDMGPAGAPPAAPDEDFGGGADDFGEGGQEIEFEEFE